MSEQDVTPLLVPASHQVLLFGGLFDPPHWAHVNLAMAARDVMLGKNAWLVYVPAAQSPHKPDGPVASDEHRLAMLGLALAGHSNVAIWTDELDRQNGPSYWVDTVRRAHDQLGPETELRFLIGADQALAFHRWHEHDRILELAEPMVMLREPATTPEALVAQLRTLGVWSDEEIDAWRRSIVPQEALEMSSTDVRSRLRRGEQIDAVDDQVRGYIARHRLYE